MDHKHILKLRARIREKVPQDTLQLKPNTPFHIYYNPRTGGEYISTTTKNRVISSPQFQDWRMNRMAEFILDHKDEISKDNFDEWIKKAKEYPETEFKAAGVFGTLCHSYIHKYFIDWILRDQQPASILQYIDGSRGPREENFRVWSVLRSLENWVNANGYIPLASELMLWSDNYNLAGTMDNVGVDKTGLPGTPDWKTSNNFRDDYFLQLGSYFGMFYEMTHIRLHWGKIVKLDKDRGQFSEEVVNDLRKCFKYHVIASKLYDAMQDIRGERHQASHDKKVKL